MCLPARFPRARPCRSCPRPKPKQECCPSLRSRCRLPSRKATRQERRTFEPGGGKPVFRETGPADTWHRRSEEHTSELQSLRHLVCRLLLEKKKKKNKTYENIILKKDTK